MLIPAMDVLRDGEDAPFMQYSTRSAKDVMHPAYQRLSLLGYTVTSAGIVVRRGR